MFYECFCNIKNAKVFDGANKNISHVTGQEKGKKRGLMQSTLHCYFEKALEGYHFVLNYQAEIRYNTTTTIA